MTRQIYRAPHLSLERNRDRPDNITNLNVSALPDSSLTSWTLARAVLILLE